MWYTKLDIFRQKHKISWQCPFILWSRSHRERAKENSFCGTDSPFTSNSFHFIYFMYDLLWKITLFSETSVVYCWGEERWIIVLYIVFLFFHLMWVWCQTAKFRNIHWTNPVTMTLFSSSIFRESSIQYKISSKLSSPLNHHIYFFLREHRRRASCRKINTTNSPFAVPHYMIVLFDSLLYWILPGLWWQADTNGLATGVLEIWGFIIQQGWENSHPSASLDEVSLRALELDGAKYFFLYLSPSSGRRCR